MQRGYESVALKSEDETTDKVVKRLLFKLHPNSSLLANSVRLRLILRGWSTYLAVCFLSHFHAAEFEIIMNDAFEND